jgi:hypothetical protein
MYGIIVVAVVVVVLFGLVYLISRRNPGNGLKMGLRSTNRFVNTRPPETLGVRPGHPASAVAARLEALLDSDFTARVRDRVLKAQPEMNDSEWNWTWFELKRFLLMAAIMRQVNMYSAKADVIWHEMLMFTREYQQFCEQLCGVTIHHAPHGGNAEPDRGERAWFDWVYSELFLPVSASGRVWGSFYRTPLPNELIEELEITSQDRLRESRFNAAAAARFPDIADVVNALIDRAKMQIAEARDHESQGRDRYPDRSVLDPGGVGMLGGMIMFASIHQPDTYYETMNDLQTKEERQAGTASCGSGGGGGESHHNGSQQNGHHGDGGGQGSDSGSSGSSGSDGGSGGGDSGGGGSSCGGGGCSS